jgi:hypothetical protein
MMELTSILNGPGLVGLLMLAGLIVVCRLYFFRAPLIGVSISFVFYVVSIALSRA